MKTKGAMSMVAIIALVLVLGIAAVFIGMTVFEQSGGAGDDLQGTDEQPLVTTAKCQDDGTNSLFAAVKNPKNASLHYEDNGLVVIGEDGSLVASGTGTAGATLAYTTLAIPCVEGAYSGTVYAMASATDTSAEMDYDFNGDTSATAVLLAPQAGALKIVSYDTTFTNYTDTSSVDGAGAGCTETEVTTNSVSDIDAGGSFSRYVDVKQATAYKTYGSEIDGKPGILIVINDQNGSSWNDGDIKVTSTDGAGNLKKVSCSDYSNSEAALDGDECYTMDDLASNDATRRLKVEGTANGGNAHSDIVMTFVDLGYYEDTDGSIVYGGHNAARTTIGQTTDCSLVINLF